MSVLSEPSVLRTLRLHYVRDVCHTCTCAASAGVRPLLVQYPDLPVCPPHVSISLALPRALAFWGILLRHSIRLGCLLFAKSHSGFPRSGCPLFCDLRMVLHRTCGRCRCTPVSVRVVTMCRCTAWPEHSPFWACLSTALASCAHSTCGLCRCDDASITPSFVIHSHLLDGIAASVCSLPPFLPASDPRLPDARLGMVLLLHHLESKSFTYRDTQLSRFKDLAAHPPVLPGFERTGRTHRVQPTSGIRTAKRS